MKIMVELTGIARSIVGKKEIELEMDGVNTYQDIIRLLGKRYPKLIGILIDQNGETFLSSNMFIINGDMNTPAMAIHLQPHDGDRLVLMSLITGG